MLLLLGMDSLNVKKWFEKKLGKKLQLKGKRLMSVGTRPLHIVSNVLLESL